MARPSKYKKEYAEQAYKFALLGLTDVQMADFFGVSEQTFNTWKKKHPAFLESLKKGKDYADAEVSVSLYKRATGYTVEEEKAFQHDGEINIVTVKKHIPPDTASAFIWLKNRQSKLWRDKHEYNNKEEKEPIVINIVNPDG